MNINHGNIILTVNFSDWGNIKYSFQKTNLTCRQLFLIQKILFFKSLISNYGHV